MSYFSDQYRNLTYPLADGTSVGLYNAQIGAIHALAAHFTVEDQPAIVTMPTGSGKTAVLTMLPFALRCERVLIITPSRLVTGQIAEDFSTLQTLKEIGVLPGDSRLPKVLELSERIKDPTDWEELRNYDVIVSTPNCTSPGYEGIPEPPEGLFDLVIIDEAHHSPARTWHELLQSLHTTRRALFSATPFRRDRAEILGRFVYNYPVARAYADRIFGEIAFVQVEPVPYENGDVAIARKTAEVFRADRAAGLDHRVMVRTDRKSRAKELAEIYGRETSLRLKIITSTQSNRAVKSILKQLETGELDGAICVNMMGEGFNFPRLKIAAIHTPHKSLEVTLQFIGRFARTNAPDIGKAKFIAVLSEIEIERRRIFDEGAIWQEIIPELSYGRIAEEVHTREVIQEFQSPVGEEDLADLSLYSLYPRSHVKIYDVPGPIDFKQIDLELKSGQEICYQNTSAVGDAVVLITRDLSTPKWSANDLILNVGYDLFVLFHDAETGLLFINSSRSVDGTYENIIDQVFPNARALATGQVGKVVRDITNQRIFNIGMRNIQAANTRESYKILTASDAQVDPADARRYRQGHVFLTGDEDGQRTTIGYSSGGKVWASSNDQIPQLLDWCRVLGSKIRNTDPVVTHSGLDFLDAGRVVDVIPEHLVYVEWNKDSFDFAPPVQIAYVKDDGSQCHGHILDLDIALDRSRTDGNRICIVVSGDGVEIDIDFSLQDFYRATDDEANRIKVAYGNWHTNLVEYLNTFHLNFYTANGSLFTGNELFEPKENALPIGLGQLAVWDWAGVDIENEVTPGMGQQSIHQKVEEVLRSTDARVVIYDHGSGEIADFVSICEVDDTTIFTLHHCKGSGGSTAGARVDDVYEVCGQAQKSVVWASLTRLDRRLRQRRNKVFVVGSEATLQEALNRAKDRRQRFEIKVVQPGISKTLVTPAMAECLGATNGHLIGVGIMPLEAEVSA